MASMKGFDQTERFAEITNELEKLSKKYQWKEIRYTLNKIMEEQRKEQKIEKEINQLENKLEKLKKKKQNRR